MLKDSLDFLDFILKSELVYLIFSFQNLSLKAYVNEIRFLRDFYKMTLTFFFFFLLPNLKKIFV